MTGIFISYRQEDAKAWAISLRDELARVFGDDLVFLDKDTLHAGNWREQIEKALSSCRVVLVVIGPRWLTITDAQNRPRIQLADDVHHQEIALALGQSQLTVIPVLVDEAPMPRPDQLPADLQRLCDQQARKLGELESERNTLALLQTIPGVDLIGAAMLLIAIGTDMDAFGCADRLASWVGICPGNNESTGKHKSGHVRKGNLYVRRLLCEFVHAASRTTSVFKSKFQSLVVRRGYKRAIIAIIAIGHKILRTIFFMLKRREHYRDSATDYEALSVQRNARRWIKALTKFGFITPANA